MMITEIVRHRLSDLMGIPSPDLKDDLLIKIIRDKPINLVWLLSGNTPKTFTEDKASDSNSMKLARVLNIILLNHFETVDEFYAAFGIDDDYINDLWSNEIQNPSGSMIKTLIDQYDIDPIYLFGQKTEMFIHPKQAQNA